MHSKPVKATEKMKAGIFCTFKTNKQQQLCFIIMMLSFPFLDHIHVFFFVFILSVVLIFRLFVTPIRCSVLADQSLILRRRRNDQDASLAFADDSSTDAGVDVFKADDIVPQIYACATMWHETRAEMTNLLKSIFRQE